MLKQNQLKLKQQEAQQNSLEREMRWEQIRYVINSFSTVACLLILGLSIGIAFGINIPNGAGCTKGNLLCQYLRWRQPKVDLKT